ncbi:MAG: tetratricopeptide repeat protein [Deltaproteobacteria bacterium]|nr:tetratricopeptide repeat protein [Deltaproteobacteria bacterium]
MSTAAVILTLLALSAPAPEAVLKGAIEDFEFGEHAQAAEKLRTVLEPIALESRENVIVARQYLGACYYLLGDKQKARTQFSMLLALDPQHRLDPAVFSPALVKLFEQVRAETGLALKEPEPPPPPPTKTTPPPPPPQLAVVPPPAHEPHSRALALVPFGVGQFANRHPVRGGLFLGSEVGLLTTAVVTFAMFESLKVEEVTPDGRVLQVYFRPEDVDRANTLQNVYLATFWSGVAVMALGIVEALISYPGDDVAPSVTVGPGANDTGGAAQGGPFVFHF